MTGAEYAVIAGVIFLAACLRASTGFGMGMLAAPVVAMGIRRCCRPRSFSWRCS
ncbi:hypothetical protein [Arthrobacter sp. ISL-5]|uniref:hypothetical protein n=1 Tax=Arthrobacter sp. ISL-5 TaxID=2819111 RepID=UPI002035A814|nr:hypothetical protein [Arthrobacter sp. ISL-5]